MAPNLAPRGTSAKIDMCSDLVGMAGFEPAASCSQSRRANQAAPHPADRSVAYRPALYRLSHRRPEVPAAPSRRLTVACLGVSALGTLAGTLSVLTWRGIWSPRRTRGRSSMAEPQPSKLVMRVRFPSPAPTRKPRSTRVREQPPLAIRTPSPASVPVACPIDPWLCPSAWP